MQRLEISGAVRPLYGSLGVKGLRYEENTLCHNQLDGILFHILRLLYSHRQNSRTRRFGTSLIKFTTIGKYHDQISPLPILTTYAPTIHFIVILLSLILTLMWAFSKLVFTKILHTFLISPFLNT